MHDKAFGILLIIIGAVLFSAPIVILVAHAIITQPGIVERVWREIAPIIGIVALVYFSMAVMVAGYVYIRDAGKGE